MKNYGELKRRCIILITALVMLFTAPVPGWAEGSTQQCQHHIHNEECDDAVESEGSECSYQCNICSVQQLIDILPDKVTEENAASVQVQLTAIDSAKAQLSDEELSQVDFDRYVNAISWMNALEGQTNTENIVLAEDTRIIYVAMPSGWHSEEDPLSVQKAYDDSSAYSFSMVGSADPADDPFMMKVTVPVSAASVYITGNYCAGTILLSEENVYCFNNMAIDSFTYPENEIQNITVYESAYDSEISEGLAVGVSNDRANKITNRGTILGGYFSYVDNYGVIKDGIYTSRINNYGSIEGGAFEYFEDPFMYNATIYDYGGTVSETVKNSGVDIVSSCDVVFNIINLSHDAAVFKTTVGEAYSFNLIAEGDYMVPENISVSIGGTIIDNFNYEVSSDSKTAEVYIASSLHTGDIVIAAEGMMVAAAPVAALTVGDVQAVKNGVIKTASGEGWEYDADSNTLTLTNASINTYSDYGYTAGIGCEGDLNIVLAGNNIIGQSNGMEKGIYVTGEDVKLNISGDGTLVIDMPESEAYSYAIEVCGDISVSDHAKLTLKSGKAYYSLTICCTNLTIGEECEVMLYASAEANNPTECTVQFATVNGSLIMNTDTLADANSNTKWAGTGIIKTADCENPIIKDKKLYVLLSETISDGDDLDLSNVNTSTLYCTENGDGYVSYTVSHSVDIIISGVKLNSLTIQYSDEIMDSGVLNYVKTGVVKNLKMVDVDAVKSYSYAADGKIQCDNDNSHYGGDGTENCKQGRTCVLCGSIYGETGDHSYDLSDGKCTVCEAQALISITVNGNTSFYTEIDDTVYNGGWGQEDNALIILYHDVSGSLMFSGTAATVDLNGHSIRSVSSDFEVMCVDSESSITLKGQGVIEDLHMEGSSFQSAVSVLNHSSLVFDGPEIISQNCGLFLDVTSSLVFNSGSVTVEGSGFDGINGGYSANGGAMIINGGTVTSKYGTGIYSGIPVTINGGKISGGQYGVNANDKITLAVAAEIKGGQADIRNSDNRLVVNASLDGTVYRLENGKSLEFATSENGFDLKEDWFILNYPFYIEKNEDGNLVQHYCNHADGETGEDFVCSICGHIPQYDNVFVGGVQLNVANKDDIFGDGTAKFEPSADENYDGTLYLTNANLAVSDDNLTAFGLVEGLSADKGLNIVLEGENTITANASNEFASLGIMTGNLTISGEGTLNVVLGNSEHLIGISASNLTIGEKASVNINIPQSNQNNAYVLYIDSSIINNGSLKFTGENKQIVFDAYAVRTCGQDAKHPYGDDFICLVCGESCTHNENTNTIYTDNGDGTHGIKCSVCDKSSNIEEHKGGIANCEKGKICTQCFTEYTLADDANHTYTNGICCGVCGEHAQWSFDSVTGKLTITGTGAVYDYYWAEEDGKTLSPWYGLNAASVELGEGISSIGTFAFSDMNSLVSADLPDSLIEIGEGAFSCCSSLKEITLPSNLKTIGINAFGTCASLTEIAVPDSVEEIKQNAFSYCTELIEAELPENLHFNVIDYALFKGCSSLKKITIPESVKEISSYAFAECTSLTELIIPSGVTKIYGNVFKDSGITDIYMMGNAPQIASKTFNGASADLCVYVNGKDSAGYETNDEGSSWYGVNVVYVDKISTAELNQTYFTYSGYENMPVVVVKDYKGEVLAYDEDYTVSYKDNINAGTAEVIITGKGSYGGTIINCFEIGKLEPMEDHFVFSANNNLIYDGSPKDADVAPKDHIKGMGEVTVKYYDANGMQLDGAPVNAGQYMVKILVSEGENYMASQEPVYNTEGSWRFEIEKTAPVYTAPSAIENLAYTGQMQQLITEGATEHGTLVYRLAGSSNDFSTDIPSASEVGNYTVLYQVIGDENHYDSEVFELEVSVERGEQSPIIISNIPEIVTYGDTFTLKAQTGEESYALMWEIFSGSANASVDQEGNVRIEGAGEFTVQVISYGGSCYQDASAKVTITAQQKEITVTEAVVQKIVYNGAPDTIVTDITLNGVFPEDECTAAARARFADVYAGTDKTVYITDIALYGKDAANYKLTSTEFTVYHGVIERAELTVKPLENQTKVYGEDDPVFEYAITEGQLVGDDVLTGALSRESGETVGEYAYRLGTLENSNYSFVLDEDARFVITKAAPDVSNVTASIAPNGTNSADIVFTGAEVEGEYADVFPETLVWGENEVEFTFIPLDDVNYTSVQGKATVTVIDTLAPVGSITVQSSTWSELLSNITFSLLFNKAVDVEIFADDDLSGAAKVEYLESDTELTENQLMQSENWQELNSTAVHVAAEDAKQLICYVRITDHAGNTALVSSDGMEFDMKKPAVTVPPGNIFYTTQCFNVTDEHLDYVEVNGDVVTEYVLTGDCDQSYVIIAKDKAGNSSALTITMKPISSISDQINALSEDKVTADDQAAIDEVQAILDSIDTTNATQEEKGLLNNIQDFADGLDKAIAQTEKEVSDMENQAAELNPDRVTSDDQVEIEQFIDEMENKLNDTNLTAEQKGRIQQAISEAEAVLKKIAEDQKIKDEAISEQQDLTAENVTEESAERLADAKAKLETLKSDDNYTESDKEEIQAEIDRIEMLEEVIEETSKTVEKLEKEVKEMNSDEIESSDQNELEELKKKLEKTIEEFNLSVKQKDHLLESLEIVDNLIQKARTYVVRLSGKTRYETSILSADELKAHLNIDRFEAIIIASGENFADALSGSYLAAKLHAPILLTNGKNLTELKTYAQENLCSTGKIYILGGNAAVSANAEEIFKEFDVKRLSGKTRFETNLEILKEAGIDSHEILIARAYDFADSLSASSLGKPILLVDNKLTTAQKGFIEEHQIDEFVIIGGSAAVRNSVEHELIQMGHVERIAGKDRYETSVKVAERYFADPDFIVLVYSRNYPDGLSAGGMAAAMNAPIILTDSLEDTHDDAASDYGKMRQVEGGAVLGGSGLISDETVRTVFRMSDTQKIHLKQ